MLNRTAKALAQGRYASAIAAVAACRRELVRTVGQARSAGGVWQRLLRRAPALGWVSGAVPWTRHELRVVDRYARRVIARRYPHADAAVDDCHAALLEAAGPTERTRLAVAQHLSARLCRLRGRPQLLAWTQRELAFADEFARKLIAGEYLSARAAARDCHARFTQSRAAAAHTAVQWAAILARRARTLGRARLYFPWRRDELLVADRYARVLVQGRYENTEQAVTECYRELHRLPRWRPRTLSAVRLQVYDRAARFGPLPLSHWSASERKLIDRYTRAAIAHRYASTRMAAKACARAIAALHKSQGHESRRPVRSVLAVHERIWKRAQQLGPERLNHRHWTAPESAVARKWSKVYRRYRRGRSRMNPLTAGEMMRAELDRRGYFRTRLACEQRIKLERRYVARVSRGTRGT